MQPSIPVKMDEGIHWDNLKLYRLRSQETRVLQKNEAPSSFPKNCFQYWDVIHQLVDILEVGKASMR